MARKILTIEFDTDQDFFNTDDGGSMFDYLTNEFDNAGIVARLEEGDTVRLEALQDAVKQFEDNYKHAVLTPLTYPEPPEWLKPLTRDLHAALRASKAE